MPESAAEIWERQKQSIAGGVMSLNRAIDPMRVFVRAKGAYLWDHEGNRYIDYHAALRPLPARARRRGDRQRGH